MYKIKLGLICMVCIFLANHTLAQTKLGSKKSNTNSDPLNWYPADVAINAIKVEGNIDPKDLSASYWNLASKTIVDVNPQSIVYPNIKGVSINNIEVKSVYNNKQVAFLLSWIDSTRDVYVDADKFCDQLAIQLPVDANNIPSYMMGNDGGKVHIVHWKGIWQEDCENGFRDVKDAYPNTWVDVYPSQEGQLDRSRRVFAADITAEQIVESQKTNSMPGTYSKNPMSVIKRKTPVEEATSVGFGTLTTQETQQANGWAVWNNNKWTACIVVPVNTGNIYKAVIKNKTKVALAVWNGNYQNIGGRKHYSTWVDLILK